MTDKSVSPWAVIEHLLRSGRLLSAANHPHCRTLNLTYEENCLSSYFFVAICFEAELLQSKANCFVNFPATRTRTTIGRYVTSFINIPIAKHRRDTEQCLSACLHSILEQQS